MKALKYIGGLLLTLLALFLILGLIAPKTAKIERSTIIQAPAEDIISLVSHFGKSKVWSPWMAQDSNIITSVSGTDGQVGAKFNWESKIVGSGSQTITKLEPNLIESALEFTKPMSGKATNSMKLENDNGATRVTWTMNNETPWPWSAMNLFMNMDKMVGPDFESGLAKLKTHIETSSKKYRGFTIKANEVPSKTFIGIRKTVAFADITDFYSKTYPGVIEAIQKAGLQMDGMPAGLYYTYDEASKTTDMVAAIPIKGKGNVPGYSSFEIPAGSELCIDYLGAYDKIGDAHFAMDEYILAKGLKYAPPVIEQYITDPGIEKDTAKWLTKVYYSVSK